LPSHRQVAGPLNHQLAPNFCVAVSLVEWPDHQQGRTTSPPVGLKGGQKTSLRRRALPAMVGELLERLVELGLITGLTRTTAAAGHARGSFSWRTRTSMPHLGNPPIDLNRYRGKGGRLDRYPCRCLGIFREANEARSEFVQWACGFLEELRLPPDHRPARPSPARPRLTSFKASRHG